MGVHLCLTGVLTCVSLMTNDVEHRFICLLAIYVSSLENCLLKSFIGLIFITGIYSMPELYISN